MAALQCEICGGKLMGKPGGIFECDSCGMEYSTEWARAKIQEIKGTVKVEGTVEVQGTVKVDGPIEVKGGVSVESLLKRGQLALEDGEWESADKAFDEVLNYDPECAEAYVGKLMVDLRVKTQKELKGCAKSFDKNSNYKKAVRFADDKLKSELNGFINHINTRNAEQKRIAAEQARIRKEKQEEKARREARARIEEEKQSGRLLSVRNKIAPVANVLSTSPDAALGLKANGTVVGFIDTEEQDEDNWIDFGQCNVAEWSDIVAVSIGQDHSLGLKSDGMVVACGLNYYGQCDVGKWTDIVAISAGSSYSLGLKSNGTVVACGLNNNGECDVAEWSDIVAVSASMHHSLGVKSDGTVVACGSNSSGECDVGKWRDIVAVSAGSSHSLGLKVDGTVVACGSNFTGQCDVAEWRDIVAVSAGFGHSVGLKANGTVVACGKKGVGGCNVSKWRDIVAVSAGYWYSLGLKADGTVVACDYDKIEQCVDSWKLFNDYENYAEERKIEVEKAQKRRKGVCQHCGGEFKGLFSKKCVSCGKQKDY